MNKVYYELSREDLRDCILITKGGDEYSVSVDVLNCSPDTLVSFEGCINRALPYASGIHRCLAKGLYVNKSIGTPEIKNVIFNDPATIVFWEDGTKTVVKCQDGDEFDPEKGLAMAIAKKAYGNKGSYCNKMKKWLPKEEPVDTNSILRLADLSGENLSVTDLSGTNLGSEFLASFKKGVSDALDIIFNGTKCTPDDNNVSSKKRMTFREEVAKLRPEMIDPIFQGGVCGCPRDIDMCPYSTDASHCPSDNDCRACWDREIPDELMEND